MSGEKRNVRLPSENFDEVLSWKISSETTPGDTYVVELDSFSGNGECQCDSFLFDMRPLLVRGVTPHEAFYKKRIACKDGKDWRDCLRCKHILEARRQLADATVAFVAGAKARSAEGGEVGEIGTSQP